MNRASTLDVCRECVEHYLSEVGESKAPLLGTVLEPIRLYFRLQRKASLMKNFIPRPI